MGWFKKTFGFSSQDTVDKALPESTKELVGDWNSPSDLQGNLNSPEDLFNVVSQTPGDIAGALTGSQKVHDVISPPTWDEWGKPGEAFYNDFNDIAGILPPSWRQYADDVAAVALNFVPGVGPWLSAGFKTLYDAGQMQATQKGMDWGRLGKDAAINFGTAAIQSGANKAFKGSQEARQLRSATSAFNNGTSSALAANAVPASVSGVNNAVASFGTNASGSLVPYAQKGQSSGRSFMQKAGDSAYDAAVKPGPTGTSAIADVANQALTSTLAPAGAQPISGMGNYDSPELSGTGYGGEWGSVLNAFGDPSMLEPNAAGPRINSAALERMTQRLGANNYLQRQRAQDLFKPTGQYLPDPNSQYARQYEDIDRGTDQAYSDLLDQVDNYNRYYGLIDANPTLTTARLDELINDPSQRPVNLTDYFQGLRPIAPTNMSLIR